LPVATGRRSRRPLATVAIICVASVATLAGCDDSEAPARLDSVTGPTFDRGICVAASEGPRYTIGVADAENTGDGPVTVTSAELTKPNGITATDIDLIVLKPSTPLGEFGVWNGSPPEIPRTGVERHLWDSRVPVEGATLPVSPARLNFVVSMEGESGGTAGPVKITYEDADGDEGTWTSKVTYQVSDNCDS
jgi:hypothetical protein